jgi:hypothetical protein
MAFSFARLHEVLKLPGKLPFTCWAKSQPSSFFIDTFGGETSLVQPVLIEEVKDRSVGFASVNVRLILGDKSG